MKKISAELIFIVICFLIFLFFSFFTIRNDFAPVCNIKNVESNMNLQDEDTLNDYKMITNHFREFPEKSQLSQIRCVRLIDDFMNQSIRLIKNHNLDDKYPYFLHLKYTCNCDTGVFDTIYDHQQKFNNFESWKEIIRKEQERFRQEYSRLFNQ